MEAVKLDTHHITRGDEYRETFQFFDGENPLDLTQYDSIRMDVRRGVTEDSGEMDSFALGDGINIDPGNSARLIIQQNAIQWKGGQYYRDIRFIKDGVAQTFCFGFIQVRENITKLA
jgi:hypothetical protein